MRQVLSRSAAVRLFSAPAFFLVVGERETVTFEDEAGGGVTYEDEPAG